MFGKKKQDDKSELSSIPETGNPENSAIDPHVEVGDEATYESTGSVDSADITPAAAGQLMPENAGVEQIYIADDIAKAMTEEGLEYLDAHTGKADDAPAIGPPKWIPTVSKDEAVRDLNGMIVDGLEGIAGKLGVYTNDKLAGGNYLAILRGNVKKSRLFNEILNDDGLMIDPKRLYEFTIAEALRRQCVAERINVSNLKTYHFVAAYRVKDEEARLLLLDEANQQNWGVRRLIRAASEFRKKKSSVDAGKSILKMIGTPLKALEDPELVTMCSDKDRLLRVLSESERQQIRGLIESGKPHIEGWNQLVERLSAALSDLEEE